MTLKNLCCAIICTLLTCGAYARQELYVVKGGTGDQSGDNWENAMPELADALKWASENQVEYALLWEAQPLRILVAKGTYKPLYRADDLSGTNPTDRNNTFLLVRDVELYGGFDPGSGIRELTDTRIPAGDDGTILSGDFGENDNDDDFDNHGENAYHVVVSAGEAGAALLDGLTVRGGNADGRDLIIRINGLEVYQHDGGGIYLRDGSPALARNAVIMNKARRGGGIYTHYSSSSLAHCTVSKNEALEGGGMLNSSYSYPVLTNTCISENKAAETGGGIHNVGNSSPILVHVLLSGNKAGTSGGGIYNIDYCSPILTNVVISGNEALANGGGIYNYGNCSPWLTNVTVSGNEALVNGGGIYNYFRSNIIIRNSVIWGNGSGIFSQLSSHPVISHSLVQDMTSSENGNVSSEGIPADGSTVFTAPEPFENAPATAGDYTLKAGSAAIDRGSAGYFQAGQSPDLSHITTDLAGMPRLYGAAPDLGAYESTGTLPVTLLTFRAYPERGVMHLAWQTTTEANASHFEVQRSRTGGVFEAIGRVAAAGESSRIRRYAFTDLPGQTLIPGGGFYYRLKIVDKDGTFSFSHIVSAGDGDWGEVAVFPNPATDVLKVVPGGKTAGTLCIRDLSGREAVPEKPFSGSVELNIASLPAGVYLLSIHDGKEVMVRKIVVE